MDGLQIDNGGAYDCLMIPGAIKAADSAVKPASLCGVKVGLFTASGMTAATVCCKSSFMPFIDATLSIHIDPNLSVFPLLVPNFTQNTDLLTLIFI